MEAELNDEAQSIIYENSPLINGVTEQLRNSSGIKESENVLKMDMVHFKRTDSTNNQAKLYAAKGCKDRTLFVADCQTNGKGRRGRNWLSDAGSGLCMSLLLRPNLKPENASMLTLVAALAVAEALERAAFSLEADIQEEVTDLENKGDTDKSAAGSNTCFNCSIKWPNDIVVSGKKVCGILTEMGTDKGSIDYVVIGIGINVNIKQMPDSIRETATSLYLETGREYERADIIAEFVRAFEKYYKKFLKNCSLKGVLEDYNSKLINRKRQVRVIGAGGELMGEALGIDETGALSVRTNDGHIENIVAGEVSVRGLYGYV